MPGLVAAIPDLVAAIAAAAPEAVALRFGNDRLTYGDLIAHADRIAGQLMRYGVGSETPVGVAVERSFEQVVALLAVWRAGGAFLPLDPAWPENRMRQLLDDAQAPVAIADGILIDHLAEAGRVVVPTGEATIGAEPLQAPAVIEPEQLAYIIYTSGSTGEPKGVEITHRNLQNLIAWHWHAFGVTAADQATYLAGLGFDASVWEVWPYLTKGACLHLPDDTTRASPDLLRRWLLDEQISIAFAPTPLAEPLIAAAWPKTTALRYLLTGGDTLHLWPRRDLPFAIVNNYGPTEATVVATSGIVPPERGGANLPAIGCPIVNVQIHLLDAEGEPVADGEIGEICIGGASVGRGYRNRPDLTAEKFPLDPFCPQPGARLYRTGDLGCRLPDGQIAFHGRSDDQLKILGHRVEPDEITAALDRHPAVAQSAIVARGSTAEVRLVAYLVLAGEVMPSAQELRRFLGGVLPAYMVPTSFVRVAALPLNASGKLDRTRLPVPSASNSLRDAAYRAPSTVTEDRLAQIVADLLSLPSVGADDNFFLLGGHSLLGTQLVLRAQDAFGVDLTLRHLFEAQTVANLAAKIEQLACEKLAEMSEEDIQLLVAR